MSEPSLFSALSPEPLAARMRPAKLEEFVGQEHLLAPGKPLRQAIERAADAELDATAPRLSYAKCLLEEQRFADAEEQLLAAEQEARRGAGRDRLPKILAALVRLHIETGDRAGARPFQDELQAIEAAAPRPLEERR